MTASHPTPAVPAAPGARPCGCPDYDEARLALSRRALLGTAKTGTLEARADLGKTFGDILTNPGELPTLLCHIMGDPLGPGEELCDTLAGILDDLLPDLAAVGPEQGGGAETPNPDATAEELTDLLGVNP